MPKSIYEFRKHLCYEVIKQLANLPNGQFNRLISDPLFKDYEMLFDTLSELRERMGKTKDLESYLYDYSQHSKKNTMIEHHFEVLDHVMQSLDPIKNQLGVDKFNKKMQAAIDDELATQYTSYLLRRMRVRKKYLGDPLEDEDQSQYFRYYINEIIQEQGLGLETKKYKTIFKKFKNNGEQKKEYLGDLPIDLQGDSQWGHWDESLSLLHTKAKEYQSKIDYIQSILNSIEHDILMKPDPTNAANRIVIFHKYKNSIELQKIIEQIIKDTQSSRHKLTVSSDPRRFIEYMENSIAMNKDKNPTLYKKWMKNLDVFNKGYQEYLGRAEHVKYKRQEREQQKSISKMGDRQESFFSSSLSKKSKTFVQEERERIEKRKDLRKNLSLKLATTTVSAYKLASKHASKFSFRTKKHFDIHDKKNLERLSDVDMESEDMQELKEVVEKFGWDENEAFAYLQVQRNLDSIFKPCIEDLIVEYYFDKYNKTADVGANDLIPIIEKDAPLPDDLIEQIKLKKIAIITSVFQQSISMERIIGENNMPPNRDYTCSRLLELLQEPEKHIFSARTMKGHRTVTKGQASEMIRYVLMQYINNNKDCITSFNRAFQIRNKHGDPINDPNQPVKPEEVERFKHLCNYMNDVMQDRMEESTNIARNISKARYSRGRVAAASGGTLSAGVGALGIAMTQGALTASTAGTAAIITTLGIACITAGVIGVVAAGVATAAFLYFRHRKRQAELRKLDDLLEVELANYEKEPTLLSAKIEDIVLGKDIPQHEIVHPEQQLRIKQTDKFHLDMEETVKAVFM